MPYLYKILAKEVEAPAYIALAPMHCYIKHKNEQDKWVNLELTNGSFSRDEWIMQQTGVTVEQIKTGIYMSPLNEKESLALILENLGTNYQKQFGVNSDFDLRAANTGLKYYINGVYLYMLKYEHYKEILLNARKMNDRVLQKYCNDELAPLDRKIIELGYKPVSQDDYREWVETTEKGKKNLKQNIQQRQNNEAYEKDIFCIIHISDLCKQDTGTRHQSV